MGVALINKLKITFHNPNSKEDLQKALIKIAAEIAKVTVEKALLHSQKQKEIEET